MRYRKPGYAGRARRAIQRIMRSRIDRKESTMRDKNRLLVIVGILAIAFGATLWASVSSSSLGVIVITLNKNYKNSKTSSITASAPVTRIPSGPKRYRFSFGGWFLDAACTKQVGQENPLVSDVTVYAKWNVWGEAANKAYDMVIKEMVQGSQIVTRPRAYEPKEVFIQYANIIETLQVFLVMNNTPIDSPGSPDMVQMANAASGLRSQLNQVKDSEEGLLYIWGDNMAQADDAADYDFFLAADNKGFKPFLVPYILADQTKIKGNVIVIAGGGSAVRVNSTEGYPVAEYFNGIGYNAFVLQRRVAPFPSSDSSLDLQRAVRYLRYNADKLGIAKTDKIIAEGMSGGGGTIMGAINDYYGAVLPSKTYPKYKPDEIDKVNSDLQAVLAIYGARPLTTENPNLPPTFMAAGENDFAKFDESSLGLYKQLKDKGVHVDLHLFADTPHGFVLGSGLLPSYIGGSRINEVDQWPNLAKVWLDIELGYAPRIVN